MIHDESLLKFMLKWKKPRVWSSFIYLYHADKKCCLFCETYFLSETMSSFECPICLELFQDPIILPCGHTFDELCTRKMIDA